ncbi:ABC transporter substrate-binding protein [Rhizobacter sp. J219]|uniref:ABC transporter substrate-binding protein n=1 Tax=Rhizobacter sp. J219 TaxID=2898430 RepID=UPI002150E2D8|nr:ABC transporter substrate-binding protein [Rhizobacter sp. J219]
MDSLRHHALDVLRRAAIVLLGSLMTAATAFAAPPEDGVTPDTIVISRVIALSGPAGAKGREQEAALKAYIASVNAAGIHGRKIVLRTTDLDLRAESALAKIYDEQRPFAFFMFGGTAGSTVAMGFASPRQIPFVAPNSGAAIFHTPRNGTSSTSGRATRTK